MVNWVIFTVAIIGFLSIVLESELSLPWTNKWSLLLILVSFATWIINIELVLKDTKREKLSPHWVWLAVIIGPIGALVYTLVFSGKNLKDRDFTERFFAPVNGKKLAITLIIIAATVLFLFWLTIKIKGG